jgi:hypothetical protein
MLGAAHKDMNTMRLLTHALLLDSILCVIALGWVHQKIETRIGPFDLSARLEAESKIVSLYGQGYLRENRVGDRSRIYYLPEDKAWLEIQFSHVLDPLGERFVESILLTKQKLCETKYRPKQSFGKMVTSAGIQLGDSIGKTVHVYGSPTETIEVEKDKLFSVLEERLKPRKGEVIRYLPSPQEELGFAEFYFDQNGLNAILVSVAE